MNHKRENARMMLILSTSSSSVVSQDLFLEVLLQELQVVFKLWGLYTSSNNSGFWFVNLHVP